jgi:glycosyltransferase involved in cell wall biosynthesis
LKFSILIAVYNAEEYIVECIESALCQNFTNFEVVICDDGSIDESLKLIERYKQNSRIRIFKNKENKGIGYTKRMLIENSHGEYFGFLDADDFLDPNAISEVLLNFDDEMSLIYTDSVIVNHLGKIVKVGGRSKIIINSLLEDSFNYPVFHFVAINRAIYKLTTGIKPDLKTAEDLDLWLKLEEHGKLVFLKKQLYFYRIHNKGVSQYNYDKRKIIVNNLSHFQVLIEACGRRGVSSAEIVKNTENLLIYHLSMHKLIILINELLKMLNKIQNGVRRIFIRFFGI